MGKGSDLLNDSSLNDDKSYRGDSKQYGSGPNGDGLAKDSGLKDKSVQPKGEDTAYDGGIGKAAQAEYNAAVAAATKRAYKDTEGTYPSATSKTGETKGEK